MNLKVSESKLKVEQEVLMSENFITLKTFFFSESTVVIDQKPIDVINIIEYRSVTSQKINL